MDYAGRRITIIGFFILITFLCSCSNNTSYAPVVNGIYQASPTGTYQVKHDDTLYSIAWGFGLDFRVLAAQNHINYPYAIHEGQILSVDAGTNWVKQGDNVTSQSSVTTIPSETIPPQQPQPPSDAKQTSSLQQHAQGQKLQTREQNSNQAVKTSTVTKIKHLPTYSLPKNPIAPVGKWLWPAKGRVIEGFSPANGNKGINIAGVFGSPIYATASGVVVYSGNGLTGYGNLIIIKHNDNYLSAYADNKELLVKEGQSVTKGQQIATMGKTSANVVQLHFEIRKVGQPVDPMKYLS